MNGTIIHNYAHNINIKHMKEGSKQFSSAWTNDLVYNHTSFIVINTAQDKINSSATLMRTLCFQTCQKCFESFDCSNIQRVALQQKRYVRASFLISRRNTMVLLLHATWPKKINHACYFASHKAMYQVGACNKDSKGNDTTKTSSFTHIQRKMQN